MMLGPDAGILGARRRRVPAGRPGTPDLIGWLLRTNRQFAADSALWRVDAFAAAFSAGRRSEPVSASTVSRWETAVIAPSHAVVRRYESLLGLRMNQLVAPIDAILRYSAVPTSGPPMLRRSVPDEDAAEARLEVLLDLAVTDALMSGNDWDEMTSLLALQPRVVLVPRSNWAVVVNRLVQEMTLSDGAFWMQRFEALNRMLVHPRAQVAAIDACAALARDTDNQVFTEVIGALDGANHPDASAHVLRQLREPVNEPARYGALLATVRKVRFRHFAPDQVNTLIRAEFDLLRDPDVRDDARELARELLRHTPPDVRNALRGQFRSVWSDVDRPDAMGRFDALAHGSAGVVTDRIVRATQAAMPRDAAEYADDMLPHIVYHLLFHPVFDVRLYAAFLINATPYRPAVAAALAAEIAGSRILRDLGFTRSILEAFRALGGPDQRRLVERLIVARGLPRSITVAAAAAIGHVGGRTSDAAWTQVLRVVIPPPGQWNAATGTTLNSLIYGAGITHADAALRQIRSSHEVPASYRASAAWWLALPAHIRDSALDPAHR